MPSNASEPSSPKRAFFGLQWKHKWAEISGAVESVGGGRAVTSIPAGALRSASLNRRVLVGVFPADATLLPLDRHLSEVLDFRFGTPTKLRGIEPGGRLFLADGGLIGVNLGDSKWGLVPGSGIHLRISHEDGSPFWSFQEEKTEVVCLEAKTFESRTRKELHNLLFGEPEQKLTRKDVQFFLGALLAEAKELPPFLRKPLVCRIYKLEKESEGKEAEEARAGLQAIWNSVHSKSNEGLALPGYLGGGSH